MARMIFVRMLLLGCVATAGGPGLSAKTKPAHPVDGPLLLTLEGRGVQVYRCTLVGSTPTWVLDHPDADLVDAKDKVVGHHDAGPAWHLNDGSMVTGEVLEKTASSEADDIPSLWLKAVRHGGAGLLAGVVTIRRTQVHGGVAPAEGCDAGEVGGMMRVPYMAKYTFYGKLSR